jgi:hypothetical protein
MGAIATKRKGAQLAPKGRSAPKKKSAAAHKALRREVADNWERCPRRLGENLTSISKQSLCQDKKDPFINNLFSCRQRRRYGGLTISVRH